MLDSARGVYVTGFSGRFPGCDSVREFWEHVCAGRQLPRSSGEWGRLETPVEFLGHSLDDSREVMLMEVVYEALCDASYCKADLEGSDTAVFMCMSSGDCSEGWGECIAAVFGFRGPVVMMNNSASLVALDLAIKYIRSEVTSRVVVVDGDLVNTLGVVIVESHHVSPNGGLLELRGSGVSTGGGEAGLVALMEAVCSENNVDPRQVVYVEAQHDFFQSSGKQADDPILQARRDEELGAVEQLYGYRPVQSCVSDNTSLSTHNHHSQSQYSEIHPATATMRLRQEETLVFSSKATSISSGATWTLPIHISSLSASIHYKFHSRDGDMIFAMYFITERKKSALVPQRLFDFSQDKTNGKFNVNGPGTLYLRWSNTHSWFGEKILSYEVVIHEIEHPVLSNPQQKRIEESMKMLNRIGSAINSEKSSIFNLESYVHHFQTSELQKLEDEYNKCKDRLISKKSILKPLQNLLRRGLRHVQSMEDNCASVGLRVLNTYQLSHVLSFLENGTTSLVCKYWLDVGRWKLKSVPPSTDYAQLNAQLVELPSMSIDDKLNEIIESFVESEVSESRPQPKRQFEAHMLEMGAVVGSLQNIAAECGQISGIMRLIKVICIFTEKTIPVHSSQPLESYHFSSLRPFLSGHLRYSKETQVLQQSDSAVIALNCLSQAGSNIHIICSDGGVQSTSTTQASTRYVFGRSLKAVNDYILVKSLDFRFWQKHLRQSTSVETFPWRGIVNPSGPNDCEHGPVNILDSKSPRKVAFCYAGNTCPWEALALQLWHQSNRFREVVAEGCAQLPIDVEQLFSKSNLSWMQLQMPDFGITLVQVGLTVLLGEKGIRPDVICGSGVGEIACGFADGRISASDAIRLAYYRSQLGQTLDLGGLMLSASLAIDRANELVKTYDSCTIACHNSPDEVIFSGNSEEIKHMEETLRAMGVKATQLTTGNVCYHSRQCILNKGVIIKKMKDAVEQLSRRPTLRSDKWISTSCHDCINSLPHLCHYPTVGYEVNNICNMENIVSILPHLSSDMHVLEIGASAFSSLFNESNAPCSDVSYQVVDGTGDSLQNLSDQLWLQGVPLYFGRVHCNSSITERINVNWDTPCQFLPIELGTSEPLPQQVLKRHKSDIKISISHNGMFTKAMGVELSSTDLVDSDNIEKLVPLCKMLSTRTGYSVRLFYDKDMLSLRWFENCNDPDCEVKFCSINAIDVSEHSASATTELSLFDYGHCPGREYSGVREDGVAVMGISREGCLATHITSSKDLVWQIPSYLSLEESATLPLDYCIAYCALVIKASFQHHHVVLINNICSSVGQATYHLCRHHSCDVVALCPHDRINWAHENVGIDLKFLFDNEKLEYAKNYIMARTHGLGVDIIIHHSSQELSPFSLELVKHHGQVCIVDHEIEAFSLEPWHMAMNRRISCHFIDVQSILRDSFLCEQVYQLVNDGLLSGGVIPLKFKEYNDVESALKVVQCNANVGSKTLVRMNNSTRLFPEIHDRGSDFDRNLAHRVFKTKGTHLVIGSWSTNAHDMVSFLLETGASSVVIAVEGEDDIHFQDNRASRVECDLSSPSAVDKMFENMGNNLVGIWYLHQCSDQPLMEDEWHAKLKNVDLFSRNMLTLEIFTVFSQCRDIAGNVVAGYAWKAEALCNGRQERGLPAVAIQLQHAIGLKLFKQSLLHLGDIFSSDKSIVVVSLA